MSKYNTSKILFYGEMPELTIHGISLSNRLNLDILKKKYEIVEIIDKSILSEHGDLSSKKVVNILNSLFDLVRYSFKNKFAYLYLTFSMSPAGAAKTLLMILAFRVVSKGDVIIHIHRGDFIAFYGKGINKIFTKLISKLVTTVIVLADSQVDRFANIFGDKIEVLENSLEDEYCFGNKMIGTNKFIYISNYILEKGILDLLAAFKVACEQFKDIYLECYGSFATESLKEKILAFQSPYIAIHGVISGKEKYEKIFASDCLILPSWNEGQPLVLLEAMSQGTPVIATDVGLIRDQLGEQYQFIVKPRDKEQLINAIVSFIRCENKDSISDYLKNRYKAIFAQTQHRKKLYKIFS